MAKGGERRILRTNEIEKSNSFRKLLLYPSELQPHKLSLPLQFRVTSRDASAATDRMCCQPPVIFPCGSMPFATPSIAASICSGGLHGQETSYSSHRYRCHRRAACRSAFPHTG